MVQNGAACCTFQSMIDLDKSLTDLGLRSVIALQVHDSIVVDTYPGEEEQVVRLVTQAIEAPDLERWDVRLSVPLIADVSIGESWGNLEAWASYRDRRISPSPPLASSDDRSSSGQAVAGQRRRVNRKNR